MTDESLYCGRFVGVCRTKAGACGVFYRVSSRSFPNRTAVAAPGGALIVPRDPREAEVNPYIDYRCLRRGGGAAVVRWLVMATEPSIPVQAGAQVLAETLRLRIHAR